MRDPDFFAQWLRERRKALRLTQAEVAERAGISFSAMQKLEGGQRQPSEQVATLLAEALGIPAKERARFTRLAKGVSEGGVEEGEEETATPNNLPVQLTSLVGRDNVLDQITELLRQEGEGKGLRLLTLTGSPGIGKTRLALQLASRLLPDFDDGVFLVMLAPVQDPGLVVQTIAGTVGLRDKGTEPISLTLKEHLREKKMLLVLDNFEHLVEAGPSVVELLWNCSQVKMLVTSREALHVRGEQRYQVPTLNSEDSVQLFVERARQSAADFSLTEENEKTIAAICERMEGVPLAIELVAARVRLLPPRALLARLDKEGAGTRGGALPLLVGGQRDLPERHRTLRSAINWSYELLSPAEQRMFRRLGVFVGGCTPASAEGVCNARDDLGIDLFEGLASLLDKNLIQMRSGEWTTAKSGSSPVASEEARYTMLETVREYAIERLQESGEREEVKQWHAQHFLALARLAEPQLTRADQTIWLDRLERDLDNLRAALAWSLESDNAEIGVEIVCAMHRFWMAHGQVQEGTRWMEAFMERPEESPLPPRLRVKLLNRAGAVAWWRSDYARAELWLKESLKLAREEADDEGVAMALNSLGIIRMYLGDRSSAKALYEEALLLRRKLDDTLGMAATLNNLAIIEFHLGALEEAIAFYQEGITHARKLEDTWVMALFLGNLAHSVRRQGKYEEAEELCQQSLHLYSQLESKRELEVTRNCLADIARCTGQHERALKLYKQAIKGSAELGNHYMTGLNLLGLACLAAQEEQPEKVAKYLGALDALVEKGSGALILPVDRPDCERVLSFARSALGEVRFEEAWTQGRAMKADQLISYVLGEVQ